MPDPAIQTRTVCKHSVLYLDRKYHIYLCPANPVEKAVRLSRDILTFFFYQSDHAISKEKQQLTISSE